MRTKYHYVCIQTTLIQIMDSRGVLQTESCLVKYNSEDKLLTGLLRLRNLGHPMPILQVEIWFQDIYRNIGTSQL